MGDLTPLGDALKNLPMTTSSPSSPSSTDAQVDARRALIELRPTAEIVAAHAAAQLEIEQIARDVQVLGADDEELSDHERHIRADTKAGLHRRRERARKALERLDVLLDMADERDRLAAVRPESCWCLGVGATGERFIPDGDGGGIPVRTDYCACPDGQAAQAADDRIRDAYRRGLKRARLDRYFGATRVPPRYTNASLESYPVSVVTEPAVERLRGYSASCGQATGRSLLLWGPHGVGKTGLAVATMRAAVEAHGIDALFVTVPDLLGEIRNSYGSSNHRSRMPYATDEDEQPQQLSAGQLQRLVRETTLLVLDDLGAERVSESGWVEETLYTLINHRYVGMLRTIFTSNLDTLELAKHLGPRTLWRIVEMADAISFEGAPNLRLPEAQR